MAEATISVLPAVQAALFAQMTTAIAASALPGTQVTYSHPGETIQPECCYMGEAIGQFMIPVSRGPVRVARQEDWMQDVFVSVSREGDDASAATADAFVIYGAIENMLATNPTLGVNGVIKVTPHDMKAKIGFSATRKGWDCVLHITLAIEGRLY